MYHSGKTLHQPLIEVAEFNGGSDITWLLEYWPLFYGTDFA
jgi:hypothetical protein